MTATNSQELVTVTLPDVQGVVDGANPIVGKAHELIIDSKESHAEALEGYKLLKGAVRRIKEHYEPTRAALDKAKKELLSARSSFTEPLERAIKIISGKVSDYEQEQERIAREARIAEEKERQRLEEIKLRRAERAERAGRSELAEQIISEPTETDVAVPEPATEKVEGVSTRKQYSAQVTDLKRLLLYVIETEHFDLVTPNMPQLNAVARNAKEELDIPGVKLYVETVRSVRG